MRDNTLPSWKRAAPPSPDVLHGRDHRLIVAGPCSIHDHNQAFEYDCRLKAVADELHGAFLLIVMRAWRQPDFP